MTGWDIDAPWHWLGVGPGAAFGKARSQGIAVVGAIGEKDLAGADPIQHIRGAPSIVRLALRQLQRNGQAIGIAHGFWLSVHPASAPCSGFHRRPQGWPGLRAAPFFTLGPMLMDADRRGVDHLQIAVVSLGNRIENAIPNAKITPISQNDCSRSSTARSAPGCPPRAIPSAVANRCRSKPSCRQARGTPRGLFGSKGSMIIHSKSVSSYRRALMGPSSTEPSIMLR